MIRKSFILLEGIQSKSEQNIWNQDIKDWNEFLETKTIKGISQKRKTFYDRKIREAKTKLLENNATYFANILPSTETWRLYKYFQNETLFLDIETSNVRDGYITVIGMYDGEHTKVMVKDINLDIRLFLNEIKKYKLIVTFNGNVFDIPYLKKYYGDIIPNIPTIDLRFLTRKVGLKGGLKEIEQTLKIKRNLQHTIRGGDPAKLYRMWKGSGDKHYLNLLVQYNEEDIINLKPILDYCVQQSVCVCTKVR